MMRAKWYCLMVKGRGLGDSINMELYREACSMLVKSNKRAKVKGDGFEGEIKTDFAEFGIGSLVGTKFTAKVETEQGTTEVAFLVDSPDFEEAAEHGVWGKLRGLPPSAELKPVTMH